MVDTNYLIRANEIIEELIRVSQISKSGRIRVSGGRLEVDPWGILQPLTRALYGDTREIGRNHLQALYEEAFSTVDMISQHYLLLNVLNPFSHSITQLESKAFKEYKRYLDLFGEYLEKSAVGLINLDDTYDGTETRLKTLRFAALNKVEEIRALSSKLDKAYASKKTLEHLEPEFATLSTSPADHALSHFALTDATVSRTNGADPIPTPVPPVENADPHTTHAANVTLSRAASTPVFCTPSSSVGHDLLSSPASLSLSTLTSHADCAELVTLVPLALPGRPASVDVSFGELKSAGQPLSNASATRTSPAGPEIPTTQCETHTKSAPSKPSAKPCRPTPPTTVPHSASTSASALKPARSSAVATGTSKSRDDDAAL